MVMHAYSDFIENSDLKSSEANESEDDESKKNELERNSLDEKEFDLNKVDVGDIEQPIKLDNLMLHFWYNLHQYLDSSWVEREDLKILLFKNGKKANFSVWRQLYFIICSQLKIDQQVHKSLFLNSETRRLIVENQISGLDKILNFAGVATYIDNNFENGLCQSSSESEDYLELSSSISDLSLTHKKMSFMMKQRFALDRRFTFKNDQNALFRGLAILCLFLSKDEMAVWSRLRLGFDKNLILDVEEFTQGIVFSGATYRCVKRFWLYALETL